MNAPKSFSATIDQALRTTYGTALGTDVTRYAIRAITAARDLDRIIADALRLNAEDRWTCSVKAEAMRTYLANVAELALGFAPELPSIGF